jgi:hypothetical protein
LDGRLDVLAEPFGSARCQPARLADFDLLSVGICELPDNFGFLRLQSAA